MEADLLQREREAFEEWAKRFGLPIEHHPTAPSTNYLNRDTTFAWAGWQGKAALGVAAAPALPTTEELEDLWTTTHYGHPADFAADVLERWGGWMPGLLGHGGALQEAVKVLEQRKRALAVALLDGAKHE